MHRTGGGTALPPAVLRNLNGATGGPTLPVSSGPVGAVASTAVPGVSAVPRPHIVPPRVLLSALVFLSLTATFLAYTLFVGGGGEDGWMPSAPLRITARPEDTWLKRPATDAAAVMRSTLTLESNDTLAEGGFEDMPDTTPHDVVAVRAPLPADIMSVYATCHNSIQGRKLVTDDAGAICARQHVLRNGCCRSTKTIDKLSCGMCRTDVQCCRSYEYCVSCCLSRLPESDRAVDSVSGPAARFSFHSFDKCLHLCRTSSRSIKHGNVYRTPVLRHCYTEGEHALPLKFEESATVLVAKQGVSCSRACTSYRGPTLAVEESDTPGVILPPAATPALFICHEAFLPLINNCATMRQHFQCANDKCDMSAGNDQPALVVSDAPAPSLLPRGQCLLNGDEKLFDCEGHHEATNRLCVCIEADKAE